MAHCPRYYVPEDAPEGSPVMPKPVAPPRPEGLDESFLLDVANQTLDVHCRSSDVRVEGGDARDEVHIGTGSILGTAAMDEGVHYWTFRAAKCGWFSFAGVAMKDASDEEEVRRGYTLPGLEGGYCFAGAGEECTAHDRESSPAFHAYIETPARYECFRDGDRVGVLLDCTRGVLALYRNGRCVGEAFEGILRRRELYPAFGGSGLDTHFTEIRFNQPVPQSYRDAHPESFISDCPSECPSK